jgi:hypothetical protein
MKEEIKNRQNSGTVCYDSVQSLLSSFLLCRNVKVKIYKTIIVHFLFWMKTWFLTLREKRRQRMFENRVLRIIF